MGAHLKKSNKNLVEMSLKNNSQHRAPLDQWHANAWTGLIMPLCEHWVGPVDTGVPRSQESAPPEHPTVILCLGPYGGAMGGGLFLTSEVPL